MENTNNVVNEEIKVESTEANSVEVKEEKTFTQEELDKILNKKFAQWQKKTEEAKAEAEKQRKLFEKQVKEFEETKRAFENERLLNETSKQLASKNLPIEFAEMLKGNNAEKTFENIQLFETKFNEAVEKVVTERLRGNVPKTTTSLGAASITKEQFNKMDLAQRQKLFNDNRELYNELSK